MENQGHEEAVRKLQHSYWNRDFAFAFAGYFFLFMSVSVFFLLPLYLEQFHPSKSRVGVIMGIHSVTAIMVRPFLGRIVDERSGRVAPGRKFRVPRKSTLAAAKPVYRY